MSCKKVGGKGRGYIHCSSAAAMLNRVLTFFPPHTHPLTLVSDPDRLLSEEQLRAQLVELGFRIIAEPEPVALRRVICELQPISAERSVIVVTPGDLNALPYDLWQQGYKVALGLHEFFPNLDYLVLKELTPSQRSRLSKAVNESEQPQEAFSYHETVSYILRVVFDIDPARIHTMASLVAWLDHYHTTLEPVPTAIRNFLVMELKHVSAVAKLPLHDLLLDRASYERFIQTSFAASLRPQTKETAGSYLNARSLAFASDPALQALVPALLRSGTLQGLQVDDTVGIPAWAQAVAVVEAEDMRLRRFAEGLDALGRRLASSQLRWDEWQAIAWDWAQLMLWRYDLDLHHPVDQLDLFRRLQDKLDDEFYRWLLKQYTFLGGRSLPVPHHLHHVLPYLAFQRQDPSERLALLVLDGMATADWLMIKEAWTLRHPDWCFQEQLVLAQVPSITAISRQSLVSGLRPNQFQQTLADNRHEAKHWHSFWNEQQQPAHSVAYAYLPATVDAVYPPEIDSSRIRNLCLITTVIDTMVHDASQGTADVLASLRTWLYQSGAEGQRSIWLEALIERLLERQYRVTIASDHGHVAAIGMGTPQEGVLVQTRSKRARLYPSVETVRSSRERYPDTLVWSNDGLLPNDVHVLMPRGRSAFAQAGAEVVSHGGVTIEEVVVPLITLSKSSCHG